MKWRMSGVLKYARLSLITDPLTINAVRDEVQWACECGKSTVVPLFRVLSGNTTSCGCAYSVKRPGRTRTNPERTKAEWMAEMPALLEEGLPDEPWTRGSRLRAQFRCGCGNTFEDTFNNYKLEKTCGKCDEIEVHRGFRVNGFIYDGERTKINPKRTDRDFFICEGCGNREEMIVRYVWNGEKTRCSKCNIVNTAEEKYGRLKFKDQGHHKKFSTEKATFLCDCGNEMEAIMSNVLNGITKSCGSCRTNVALWYQENEGLLRSLKCPISQTDFPPGGIGIVDSIRVANEPFKAVCPVCSNQYKPRFGDIRLGKSLTCGCTSDRISSGQREVAEFIRSLGLETTTEHVISGLKYDVFVPSANLVIEYNGLLWHSLPDSKRRDLEKYRAARLSGHDYMMLFEDEWMKKRPIFESILRNRLGKTKSVGVRPKKIEAVGSGMADAFYERNHYIGPARAALNYGVIHSGKLVACASFKRPTRQSSHDWELVRMASDPSFRVHGVWEKVMRTFVREHDPSSVVSFSDNRLFSGEVYGKIGFRADGETDATYFWVRGMERCHQSAMRKREGEEGTEKELREAEGFKRIWDVGKRRWVYARAA